MDVEKLVKKAQKGNDKAYVALFSQYEEMIYRTAYVYVKNKEDALDIVQETAYHSFKSIHTLREPQYFKTWLMRIAINCTMNLLRHRSKVVPFSPDFAEQLDGGSEDDIPLSLTLQDLLDKLDTNEKSVVVLRFYQGHSLKSIADLLNLPLGSTKSLLYRSLDKLRKKLKKGEIM